jgi:hypothetical protein
MAFALELLHDFALLVWKDLGNNLVDPELTADGIGGSSAVTRDHDDSYTLATQ